MNIEVSNFLGEVIAWVCTQPDLQALALVGSYARNAATESSDIDLVLIATHPETYLHDSTWAEQFGQVQKQQLEDYGRLTSLRVWYTNGLEVEYGFTNETWVALPLDAGTQRVIADGIKILFERNSYLL
jgi:predicted nucleotidyltransferase